MLIVHLHLFASDHDCHSAARIYKCDFMHLYYAIVKTFYENWNALSLVLEVDSCRQELIKDTRMSLH